MALQFNGNSAKMKELFLLCKEVSEWNCKRIDLGENREKNNKFSALRSSCLFKLRGSSILDVIGVLNYIEVKFLTMLIRK